MTRSTQDILRHPMPYGAASPPLQCPQYFSNEPRPPPPYPTLHPPHNPTTNQPLPQRHPLNVPNQQTQHHPQRHQHQHQHHQQQQQQQPIPFSQPHLIQPADLPPPQCLDYLAQQQQKTEQQSLQPPRAPANTLHPHPTIPPPLHVKSYTAQANVYAHPHPHAYAAVQDARQQKQDQLMQRAFYVSPTAEPVFVCNMTKDTFIRVCSTYLDQCANVNVNFVSVPARGEPAGVFFSVTAPAIATEAYVRRLVEYAHCSPTAFVIMLALLDRVAARSSSLRVTPRSLHRLLTTALTLACKLLDDRCYPNAHYAKVGGVPSTSEMNRLELAFLYTANFRLHVTIDDFNAKMRDLEKVRIPNPKSPRSVLDLRPSDTPITPRLGTNDPFVTPAPMSRLRQHQLQPSSTPSSASTTLSDVKYSNSISSFSMENTKSFVDNKLCGHLSIQSETCQSDRRFDSLSAPISKVCPTGASNYNGNVAPVSKGFPSVSAAPSAVPLPTTKNYPGFSSVIGNGLNGLMPPISKGYGHDYSSVKNEQVPLSCMKIEQFPFSSVKKEQLPFAALKKELMPFSSGTNDSVQNLKGFSKTVSSGIAPIRSQSIAHVDNSRNWYSGKWGATPNGHHQL